MANVYPVVLLLEGKRAVVIGGGAVAERKVLGLLECDAIVEVISPEITEGIQELVDESRCSWKQKCYEATDLERADIVFAATDDEPVNTRVFEDATSLRLMVNVADRPELCSFYLPSVMRRGDLCISVSTQGGSPLLARRIRAELEDRYDDVYGDYVALLQNCRNNVKAHVPETKRMAFWEEATDGRVLNLLQDGNAADAEALLSEVLQAYSA